MGLCYFLNAGYWKLWFLKHFIHLSTNLASSCNASYLQHLCELAKSTPFLQIKEEHPNVQNNSKVYIIEKLLSISKIFKRQIKKEYKVAINWIVKSRKHDLGFILHMMTITITNIVVWAYHTQSEMKALFIDQGYASWKTKLQNCTKKS